MGDWTDRVMEEIKQKVFNVADQLAEERIQHLRGRINEEGATVEFVNDPANEQLTVRFDNISDELKQDVLDALHGKN